MASLDYRTHFSYLKKDEETQTCIPKYKTGVSKHLA